MHVPGVGAYRIRPPNIPQGMNDHTRGHVFAPCRGARWGVCNTPLHGYPHQQTNRAARPEWMYRPTRIRPHRVPGPPRVSPWAMIRRPYRAHGYPHQQTNGPPGPNGTYPARPGFRPGLWSTGPTARPGTGERPVGAPDHSQGRNPWAAKPWAAKPRAARPQQHQPGRKALNTLQ